MTIETVLLMSAVIFIAYLVKGVTGFGEGLVAVSIFLLFLDTKFVLPLALLLAVLGGIYQFAQIRLDARRDILLLFVLPIIVGVFIGTYFLNILDGEIIKKIFAVFVILYSVRMLILTRKQKQTDKKVNKKLGVVAGLGGGFLDGLIGLGGVPLIMFLSGQKLNKAVFRATTVASFLILGFSRIGSYAFTGLITVDVVKTTLYLLPAVVLGVFAGMKIHKRVSEKLFSKIVLVLIIVIGFLLLVR